MGSVMSSWGKSWGLAWLDAWGPVEDEERAADGLGGAPRDTTAASVPTSRGMAYNKRDVDAAVQRLLAADTIENAALSDTASMTASLEPVADIAITDPANDALTDDELALILILAEAV